MINEYEKLLAGLEDVDWAGLEHAYRSAHDVPGHIRTLCGSDDAAREQAFISLSCSIFHQGSRYSASPVAVPFLARIAVAGPAAAREDTMLLLTRLAVGFHDEYDVTTGINVTGWRAAAAEVGPEELLPWYEEEVANATDPDKRAQAQELRDWIAAGNSFDPRWSALQSYDAVLAELPGLLVLLDNDDARLRTRIAYLLAWFPEFTATSLPHLLALAAREEDPVTAATALLAVGLVGPASTAGDITPYLDAAHPLMRWAAATALIRLAALNEAPIGPGLLGRAVTELAAAARTPFDHVTDYCEGDLHAHIERTLQALPPGPDPAVVRETLDACLPRIVWDHYGPRTRRAFTELFPAPQPHPAPRYTDLTAAQQQLLHDLAGHRHPWLIRSSADRLRELGLPHTQEALQSFVGGHRTD
ncbi:HEAT repeat domain-containing protein [Streptomyces hydrogenans]|uniref:HEAT repeat domain-containing protein n=1 Tax=Streptomyces hydrogenans TaxID=1873719 RepID=UPI00380E1C72